MSSDQQQTPENPQQATHTSTDLQELVYNPTTGEMESLQTLRSKCANAKKSGSKLTVGILGVTGTVGQRFVQLLENHPWFQVTNIAASPRSAGKVYGEIVAWKLATRVPTGVARLTITTCEPQHFTGVDIIFSALDSSVAGPIEEAFASAGHAVFSNAKNHRQDADVPILIPHANAEHISIIPKQQELRGWKTGFIVTNANCSSTGLVIALKPLYEQFGIAKLFVVTLQAISGTWMSLSLSCLSLFFLSFFLSLSLSQSLIC